MPPEMLRRRPLLAALAGLTLGQAAPAQAAPDGSLRRILDAGVIRFGVQVEGTTAAARAADGNLLGYLPELGRRIASGFGVRSEFVAVPRGDMLGRLISREFDIGLGGAIASTRVALTVLQSDPIMNFQLVAVAPEHLLVRGMADLQGLRVGVLEGLSFIEAVLEAGLQEEQIDTYPSWEHAAAALIQGGRQVAIVPNYQVPTIQQRASRVRQRFPFGEFWHCAALPLGQHDLLRALNVLLYLLRQEGELESLHLAYFGHGLTSRWTL